MLACVPVMGQFEAASVKPSHPEGTFHPPFRRSTPARVEYRNYPLSRLIADAYGLADYQIETPSWVARERYDLEAVKPRGATESQIRAMMQRLLLDRFHLATHTASKEMAVYHLLPGKSRSVLRPEHDEPDVPGCQSFGTLSEFAELLSRRLNAPVIDKTSILGTFYFILAWSDSLTASPAASGSAPPPPVAPAPPPCPGWSASTMPPLASSIFEAVKLQMGLRLEQNGRARVNVLTVDRADRIPSGN